MRIPRRSTLAGGLLFALLVVAWSPIALQAAQPAVAPRAVDPQLLANPGLEGYGAPYGTFHGVACQVATGWHRFPEVSPEPGWMDTRVFASSPLGTGSVEKIEGETSQMIVSTQPYTAGIWQQVSGLNLGVPYGFHAAMLTIYRSSALPPVDGKMIKQVGIDPTGGTDPAAATVVWSEPDGRDRVWDVKRRTAAYAQASTVTVFVRVISADDAGAWPYLNQSFLDSAFLAQTATVSAVSPAESAATTFLVRWNNAVPSPGGTIRWYDVQWMDEADGVWHLWFDRTTETQASYSGEIGHTYHFRARVWQQYDPGGAYLFSPYRLQGDTQTRVLGPEVVGRVLSHEGHPVAGATVSIQGTADSTVSDGAGRYRLQLLPSDQARTIVVSHAGWLAPAPAYDLVIGPTETVPITWTLRPLDDAVGNGGFEQAQLDPWAPIAEQGVVPQLVTAPVHTGYKALALGGATGKAYTVGVRQSAALTHAWEPAVGFWYRPETANPDGLFKVILTVAGQVTTEAGPLAVDETVVFTPDLHVADWQHLALYPLPEGYYTGSVTVQLQVEDDADGAATTVYVDEVSLGHTLGGPYKNYLPVARRAY